MPQHLDDILNRLEKHSAITGHDIVDLRRAVFNDDFVCEGEADRLFDLNNSKKEKAVGWADFFVAAITNFLIRQTKPIGYVDAEHARWFIKRIAADGHIETETELRTLFRVLNEALDATDVLVDFALSEVKAALIDGEGHMGRTRLSARKSISLDDVKMIEKVLYASGGDGNIAVTEKEAEILFDINDVCIAEPDAKDAWQSVFVYGVTNSVMFYTPHKNISRDDALRSEEWLEGRGGFFGSMISVPNFGGAIADMTGLSKRRAAQEQAALEAFHKHAMEQSEKIVASEAYWLTSRISRDGDLNENERALLRHLEQMCPNIHSSLQAFIEAA